MNYLSIDIGGTFCKFALINHSGVIKTSWQEPTPANLPDFKVAIKKAIVVQQAQIKSVAISCPGRIDSQKKYIHTAGALLYLYEFSLSDFMAEVTTLPFAIINDGKAAALAEFWIGNLKDINNGAAVVLGTGIGGGLIVNHQLLQGEHFQAGELSFMLRQPEKIGETRLIGNSGSAVQFIQQASALLDLPQGDHEAVFAALAEGHQPVSQLFKRYCREIAWLIINLQVTLDLQRVVIGGGISAQPQVIEEITEQYNFLRKDEAFLGSSFAALEIMSCAYKNQANLLGALYHLFLQMENE